MGDQYRKALDTLSAEQRKKFLEEDWNSYFMLLELYSKLPSASTDFETFSKKFCESLVNQSQADQVQEDPYSWNEYIREQLKNSSHPVPDNKTINNLPNRDGSPLLENLSSTSAEKRNKEPKE